MLLQLTQGAQLGVAAIAALYSCILAAAPKLISFSF